LWGEDPAKGGYDANILKRNRVRAARATYAARRALEQGFVALRIWRPKARGTGTSRFKQAIEEGTIPGPRILAQRGRFRRRVDYNLEDMRGMEMPKGAQLVDGRWKRERRRGSTGARRDWNQGVHDAPVVGGQAGEPWSRSRADVEELKAHRG